MWGCWVETQASIPSAVGRTRIALPSIGAVAMRWLTIRTRVTWSASSRTSEVSLAARWVGDVGADGLELQRGVVGERVLDVGDHRQVVVVDVDQLGGVHRLGAGLGDHEGDRVADVADLVDGQGRAAGLVVDVGEARERFAAEVVGGVDGEHARRRGRLGGVDAGDPGVRERAAHEDRVGDAVALEVVDEGALTEQQLEILDTADFGSKDRSGHAAQPTPEPATLSGRAARDDARRPRPGVGGAVA